MEKVRKLLDHILTMADDAYLEGHPEWEAICKEAFVCQVLLSKDQLSNVKE